MLFMDRLEVKKFKVVMIYITSSFITFLEIMVDRA